MNARILYEDEAMLVIDKPSGMIVNKADTTRDVITLQDEIITYLHLNQPVIERGDNGYRNAFLERSGIVHRLDKETSGLLLIAKTEAAFITLQAQFKERTVKKTYKTLVHGEIKPSSGEVNAPIGRQEWNRMRFGVVAGGKEAVTLYTVLEYRQFLPKKEAVSFLEIELKTGRTHQIRVHMKFLGYPLFADFLYGGRKQQRDDRKFLSRVFLHAATISFQHPITQETLYFSSELPPELQEFLDTKTEVVSK